MNVHKTFRKPHGCLLSVLRTFVLTLRTFWAVYVVCLLGMESYYWFTSGVIKNRSSLIRKRTTQLFSYLQPTFQFNFIIDGVMRRPFFRWLPFSQEQFEKSLKNLFYKHFRFVFHFRFFFSLKFLEFVYSSFQSFSFCRAFFAVFLQDSLRNIDVMFCRFFIRFPQKYRRYVCHFFIRFPQKYRRYVLA